MRKIALKSQIIRSDSETLVSKQRDQKSPETTPRSARGAETPAVLQSSGSLTNVFLADGSALDSVVGKAQLDISAVSPIGTQKEKNNASLKLIKKVSDDRGQITRCILSKSSSVCYISSIDGNMCVYDCSSHQFLARMKIHAAGITDMDVSVNLDYAVASIADGKVHLIDLIHKKRFQVWDTVSRCATAVRFEPTKSSHVCFGDETGTVTLISLESPSTMPFKISTLVNNVKFARITALCWSERIVYVGDSTGKVGVFQFDADKCSLQLLRYGIYKTKINGLTHSSQYNLLVVNTCNSHMHVVDGTSLSLIRVFTRPNESHDVHSCFLDGQTVVSGGEDGAVYIFDVTSGKMSAVAAGGHSSVVYAVDCTEDGHLLCSVSSSEIVTWNSSELL